MEYDHMAWMRDFYKKHIGKKIHSQAIGNMPEFDGTIIDINDGSQFHFLVEKEDFSLWLRTPDELGIKI